MDVDIRRLGPGDEQAVLAAGALFDSPPDLAATQRFLAEPNHHLLIAYRGERPLGFVSGVETTHPDKGTEMFLYELGVDEPERRRGVGRALVLALAQLARERGCYGMWTGTESTNDGALATYASAGALASEGTVILDWELPGGATRATSPKPST
jgi:ribosomal protein S18 acetylase RimI-like enzyme